MAKRDSNFNNTSQIISALSKEGGYVPPQAVDLEEAVLGAIMVEPNSIFSVIEILSPDSFYKENHRIIYQAALDLSAKHEPVDLYTLSDMLRRKKQLTEVGGVVYLTSLTQKVGSAAHIEFHAQLIAQKHIQRELIRASVDIQKNSFNDDLDVTDLIDYAEAQIFKVSEGNIKRDVQSSFDVVKKALKQIEEAKNKPDGLSGVPTGFNDLDKLTLGWQPSDLVIIAARPAMGKTAFVLSMAKNMAVNFNTPIAIFSLEMSNLQLVNRLISNVCEIEGSKIKSGDLSPMEWNQLMVRLKQLNGAPLFIDDTPSLSVLELRTKARRLVREHKVKMIIIDYLQLMNASGMKFGSREQEVSMISRSLKQLAKELNIPIVALSQLNRSVESRSETNKRPQLSDLRESGAIEQDADMVCFIHRPEYYLKSSTDASGADIRGKAEFIIAKHRSGAVGDVDMRFRAAFARFENWIAEAPESGFGYSRRAARDNDENAPVAAAAAVGASTPENAGADIAPNSDFLKPAAAGEESPF